jgi:hypothetical protein
LVGQQRASIPKPERVRRSVVRLTVFREEESKLEARISTWIRLALVSLAAALIYCPAYAGDGSSPSVAQQKKIDELTREIQLMQQQQTELMSQLKEVKQEIKVPAPAASPGTEASAHGWRSSNKQKSRFNLSTRSPPLPGR